MDDAPLPSPATALPLRIPHFLVLHAFPIVVIASTIACEYVVRTGKSAGWLEGSDLMQVFDTVIQAARLLAASMALGTWTWYAGAVRIEDSPEAVEAVHVGWTSCVRITLATLPLLLLSVLYVFMVCTALRFGTMMFTSVGSWAVALWVVFVIACAVPPCLVVVAKYALLVPLAVFERAPPLPAIAIAGARMTFGTMLCLWFMLCLHSAITLSCVLLPFWCYASDMWITLDPVCGQPRWIMVRQLAGLALFVVGAPVACASMASLYFILQPRPAASSDDTAHD